MFYSDEKYATLAINAGTVGVATADYTVERHNGGNGTVNLFRGFGFISLDVSGRVGLDIVNIGLHFFLKDVRPMLPPVMNRSIVDA